MRWSGSSGGNPIYFAVAGRLNKYWPAVATRSEWNEPDSATMPLLDLPSSLSLSLASTSNATATRTEEKEKMG
jgi:hypothetical protein